MKLVIGITGSTGVIYGVRMLEVLRECKVETHLIITEWAKKCLAMETEHNFDHVKSLASHYSDESNMASGVSSGTHKTDGMIVIPCSMKTLSSIANGYDETLVARAAGCLFSYILVIPYVLEFLYKYGESSGLITFLNIMDFVSFVLQFLLAFGISFQLPLIMYATTASGATDAKFWRRNLRYAIVVIIIFGAVITPDGSGVTMWFIAAPMIVLYLAGMFFVERKEKKIATLKS